MSHSAHDSTSPGGAGQHPPLLLGPDDPPPFETVNREGGAPAVICCDHASNRVPASLGDLGAVAAAMSRHIAYDIGAAGVARRLAALLDTPAVLSGYSRLVIDCNRDPEDFTAIREIYDGTVIAGNRRLSEAERQQRADLLFHPYHDALSECMARKAAAHGHPALISVHSCTDIFQGEARPWHIGVLSNRDRRMADPVIEALATANPDLTIGDNKPYSGLLAFGYTVETHALPQGRPNILFEIRQDRIRTEEGQARYAGILADALRPLLARRDLLTPFA
ncbi:N-formylglutamate amidohydrolase [Marivibrio halodurans]|uniref:N-formylglutamate amidohydrolase n=1 Tax=Marivibrio halodurans TaxID=2039722 RepID=A0A8J7V2E6_9PROT|nr:N-formylglutamate amidohydrolase [Marivibrio halodurans]MBP5857250.1 N-formylglutamate amidohydrolase [Marivibrio halodurans]